MNAGRILTDAAHHLRAHCPHPAVQTATSGNSRTDRTRMTKFDAAQKYSRNSQNPFCCKTYKILTKCKNNKYMLHCSNHANLCATVNFDSKYKMNVAPFFRTSGKKPDLDIDLQQRERFCNRKR